MSPSQDLPADDENNNKEERIDGENIIFHCILNDNQELLSKVFDDITNQYFDQGPELLTSKNAQGRSPVEIACMLGRTDALQELIKRSIDFNAANPSSYTPLHFASCWGHRSCLETLVRNGANLDLRTKYGETARQLAVRYQHSDCIEFIDWAMAKSTLATFIAQIRELIADPEKMQGVKLTKEEKSSTLGACSEKQEWIENTPEATMEDFLMKKDELEKQVEVVINKVNSPAPPTGSSGKK